MDEFKVPNAVTKLPPPPTEDKSKPPEEKAILQKPSTPALATNCPYKEPEWSSHAPAEVDYSFEVLKNGQIIDKVKNLQSKPYWVFGRLPVNDIEMAHPTISRFHAILQYRPKIEEEDKDKKEIEEGWYVYDLGSTHGTFLNKMRIPPKSYIRIRVGHMLRLGASTRNFLLQGPEYDEEPESEMSVTELKQMRINAEEEKKKLAAMQEEAREKEGISWGMAEDADEETDLSVNPYASTNNEELFLDDPKKTLRGFFEREGLDLEYKCDEMSVGTFVCRIELPVDDSNGRPIVAEVCHKGKKKECVVQCALEACRILDRHGVLRQANHEPLKRKVQASNSDDEDDFFDRTGDVERKKMRKSNPISNVVLTYEDLLAQEKEVLGKIEAVEEKILQYQELSKRVKESKQQHNDDLDSYMENLSDESTLLDKTDIRRLRIEEKELQADLQKTRRLIQIAKPLDLPAIGQFPVTADTAKKPRQLPMIGKRNQFSFKTLKPQSVPDRKKVIEKELKSDEEEFEEEDEKPASSDQTHKEPPKEEKEKSTENSKSTKLYGPAFIPEEIKLKAAQNEVLPVEAVDQKPPSAESKEEPETEIPAENQNDKEAAATSKKRRTRQRIRGKRENVDIDDQEEYEDTEKYSKWVPPENQSGDGITSLNDKFGY